MKARLVSLRCFVLKMLPQKTLALPSICCFISLCLRVAVFLNATKRERNLPPFTSKGKEWINAICRDEEKEFMIAMGTSLFATFQDRRSPKNCLNNELTWCLVVFQHDLHGQYPPQVKESSS